MPLKGVDVSQHQGSVDWPAVKRAGYHFAICKATEGQDFQDSTWSRARVDAIRKAGLKLGAYHYLRPRPGRNGAVEARWAVPIARAAGWGKPGDIRLVCDIEETDLTSHRTVGYLVQFCNEVENLTGHKPVIYSFPAFLKQLQLPSAFGKYPLWIANFEVSRPDVPLPWKGYAIWQHTSRGRVRGISGNVDLNVSEGLPLIRKKSPPPPAEDTQFRRLRRRVMAATGPVRDLLLRRYLRQKAARGIWDDRYCAYWNVSPNVTLALRSAIMRAYAAGLVPTSTLRFPVGGGSWHQARDSRGRGRAVDFGNRRILIGKKKGLLRMLAFQHAEVNRGGWEEVIGPDNALCVLKGVRVPLREGTALENQHDNHVHLADA